jgi:hypothetical protein
LFKQSNGLLFKDPTLSFKGSHLSKELILENIEKPNVVGGPCPYCLKKMDGFRFEGCDFAYISYYCLIHGFQGNEFDHFDP